MTAPPDRTATSSAALGPAERVQVALASEETVVRLERAIYYRVKAMMKGRPRVEVVRRAKEVLGETVCQALARPQTYRPDRPVVPWLCGIAKNVIRGDARAAAAEAGRVVAVAPDNPVWDALKATLSGTGPVEARLDLEAMLARLDPKSRQAIECRFLRGLSGPELTVALGVSSDVTARQRVSRALVALREIAARYGSEVAR
jgi:DNA-directed RNA polymerase specialized sigma24 family protein